jgi:ribosomal protein L11 methyltransferase
MNAPTAVARLTCDEPTARRLAAYLGESLGDEGSVCAAFEGDDGLWHLAIHFRTSPNEVKLRELVGIAAGESAAHALRIEPVDAADWVAQSLAGLKPVHVGRFTVHGAHDRAQLKANDIGIEIEAALAFGTGHHGTTRGCLLVLADMAKRQNFRCVLDVGTGAGVLAIAAARLLRKRVVASDIDSVAVSAARDNARLNRTSPLTTFAPAAGADTRLIAREGPYDLIFANILLSVLLRLAGPLRKLAARGAYIVLSGLLPGHANGAIAIYRAQGFALERRVLLDGWVTLVMRRAPRKTKPPRGHPERFR